MLDRKSRSNGCFQKRKGMLKKTIGFMLLLVGASSFAFAGSGTPEIDGSTGMAAIALISGGMVVLWGRRRSR